jgi:chromosome segregation ATPase
MNTLGKILAVVNLVLSVLVAAFIVNAYVARTNWHAAFEDQRKNAAVLLADRDAYVEETVKLREALATEKVEVAKSTQEMEAAKADLKKHDADWAQKLDALTRQAHQLQGGMTSSGVELDHRQKEVNYLKGLLAERDDKLKNMAVQVENNRQRAVESELAAKSEQHRNEMLLTENERLNNLAKSLQHGELAGGPGADRNLPHRNPPAEDVHGLIKALDPQSGLVTLSIGSDVGLSKGNTLEVFRLKPEAAYLGQIEILAVRPDESVGKPIVRTRGALQVGDRVASSILNRR